RDHGVRAKKVLEDVSGREIVGYRAPSFSIDRQRLAILEDCGFRYDSRHHPVDPHDRYARVRVLARPAAPGCRPSKTAPPPTTRAIIRSTCTTATAGSGTSAPRSRPASIAWASG